MLARKRLPSHTVPVDRGKPMQPVEASVSVSDQVKDDEQKTLLAALASLKAAEEDSAVSRGNVLLFLWPRKSRQVARTTW